MDDKLCIEFNLSDIRDIVADYFGYDKKDVNLNNYSEDEIRQIILDRII